MSHSGHGASESNPRWLRWLLAGMIVGTVVMGCRGIWLVEIHEYEKNLAAQAEDPTHAHEAHLADPFSIFYHSCQLLVAHGVHVHGVVPWQLHVGRFLGLGSIFLAGGLAFFKFFREEGNAMSLRAPWRRPHLVICGLGDLGLQLALGARDKGQYVVAVEKVAGHGIDEARRRGIFVIQGDACSVDILKKARIHRAEYLIAAAGEDATNVGIVASCKQLALQRKIKKPLICRLMLRDDELRQSLQTHKVFEILPSASLQKVPEFQVNLRDLHLEETTARQALRRFPLDFKTIGQDDTTVVHLVIVGSGTMGHHLALHAVRIGIFANCNDGKRKLKLTFVDKNGQAVMDSFCERNTYVSQHCEVSSENIDITQSTGLAALAALSSAPHQLVTFAFVRSENESLNDKDLLLLGTELAKLTPPATTQTLIYQSNKKGFAALFPDPKVGPGPYPHLHAFGMKEDICSWDVLLHESEDRTARALHEDYASKHNGQPWELLAEGFKESNRHAADHIPTKLRAIGCYDQDLMKNAKRVEWFNEKEQILLAEMEHHRWCIERWLAGWQHGETTDRPNKISADLVPWSELRKRERAKDYDQIDAIPAILFREGKGIYRKS